MTRTSAGLTALLTFTVTASTDSPAMPQEVDPAYLAVVRERADKLLAPLEIRDPAKLARVRELIAQQYVAVSRLDEERSQRLKEIKDAAGESATNGSARAAIEAQCDLAMFRLHRQFVADLGSELSPEQVDRVKDGMTYGVVPSTYRRYLALLPELTDEQKAVVLAHLLEAREYAMDAGSSERKHWWFGKYKGRINNYLSDLGYDLKQAERNLAQREKTAAAAAP